MDFEKGLFVVDIQKLNRGSQADGVFYVEKKRKGDTKFGKSYLSLTLKDKTGTLDAKIWDDAERRDKEFQEKDFVSVKAVAEAYNGKIQLNIKKITKTETNSVDPAFFIKTTDCDINMLWLELEQIINSLSNDVLKKLLSEIILADAETSQLFKTTAGAKKLHHAYVGGLLEHTVAVARLAEQVSCLYQDIDRDMLLSGTLLHDIGKIVEYKQAGVSIESSDAGRLIGHLVIGIQMIDSAAMRLGINPYSDKRILQLKHMILSHHGRYEYNSPVLPMTAEAFVLHFIDEIDAKLNWLGQLQKENQEKGADWSEYQNLYARQFFLPSQSAVDNNADSDLENNG